jgi:oligopeptidase A
MLTQINTSTTFRYQRGRNGDAVELLPSQFMENFALEWDVLATTASMSMAPLPREPFEKMPPATSRAARDARGNEFRCTIRCCTDHDPWRDFMPPVAAGGAPGVAVFSRRFAAPRGNNFIFAGDTRRAITAAAAEGHCRQTAQPLWQEETSVGKDGAPNVETRRKYRQAILKAGGRPALNRLRLSGREPLDAPLFRHQGRNGPKSSFAWTQMEF